MADSADPLDVVTRLTRLEARVARLEACSEYDLASEPPGGTVHRASEEVIEAQLAQTWFARIGIFALAAGGAYLLFRPHAGLPAVLPSVIGWVVSGALFLVAHAGRSAFALVSRHIRGIAMALLFCATLRLCYFGASPAVPATSLVAHLLLPAVAIINLLIAWRRQSVLLMALATAMAAATVLALADTPTVLTGVVLLMLVVAFVGTRPNWGMLLGFGAVVVYATYAIWAMGNPLVGAPYHWVTRPVAAPVLLLACIVFAAALPLWTAAASDGASGGIAALANTVAGYGILLVHTYAVHHPWYTGLHAAAAIAMLGVGAALWWRWRSEVATFLYAMCAYAALTVAIVHVAQVPNVFVWLSVESVVVVATAVWFRSRFIVITNFAIYVVVVLGYLLLKPAESGVSIGFGLVALVSARILNWQRDRLALKTELMRNAYLVSAFIVFPYATYHLVGGRYAALAWVVLAVLYYGLNVVIRNQKYRWMGHGTLLMTAGYLLIPHDGISLPWRLASFVALGTALIAVSVTSTLSRRN